jgi:hypothetical protein
LIPSYTALLDAIDAVMGPRTLHNQRLVVKRFTEIKHERPVSDVGTPVASGEAVSRVSQSTATGTKAD